MASAHGLFYWMSQHLPMRVCQFFFDHSRSFRVWWGVDYPPIPRPRPNTLRVVMYGKSGYGRTEIEDAERRVTEHYGLRTLDSLTALQETVTEEWTAYHEFRSRTDPPPYGQGLDE